MSFKIPLRLQLDKMQPAYDLAFQADVMTFRTNEKLRRPGVPGESRFYVWDTKQVLCHDVECPELENEFMITQKTYDRLVEIYKGGLRHV